MAQSAQALPQLTARARRIRELYTAQAIAAGTRPWGPAELAQGFVGDVGALMKLVMAKEGLSRERAVERFIASRQPSRRFVAMESVAALAAFLCGPAGADITGAVLPIEGGWSAA